MNLRERAQSQPSEGTTQYRVHSTSPKLQRSRRIQSQGVNAYLRKHKVKPLEIIYYSSDENQTYFMNVARTKLRNAKSLLPEVYQFWNGSPATTNTPTN